MGTHPIFESDFDCLTGRRLFRAHLAYNALRRCLSSCSTRWKRCSRCRCHQSHPRSVGVDADEEKLNKVISELSGKAIDDVLAEGKEKLASVPSGGGAAPAAGGAA